MRKYYKLPFILLLFFPVLLSAQKSWSLEECINYAWENNLQIKQQELSVEQGQNNLYQAKLNYIPRLTASMNHSMNWGRSVNVQDLEIIENKLTQSTSASASAGINLFEGFTKTNEVKSNTVQLEISRSEVEKLRNDISIEIARSYLQILLSKEILNTAKQSITSAQEQVERTEKLVDAGSVAYSSLLEVQSQLAAERVQVINAQNQLRSSLLSLKQLLDLDGNSEFDIEQVNIDFLVKEYNGTSIEELYKASHSLPQVKVAELNVENSGLQLAIAKGRLYPSLSFSAGYGTYYSDSRDQAFFDQFNENRNPSIGFGLSIPIFNNYRVKTNVKNAKLTVRRAKIEYKSRLQVLYKEIQQAGNEALSYYEKYKAAEQNVKAMEESFRYVQQKFDVGVLNATDYTVAKTNLFKAKSDYYQSKYQYVFQLKILDFYRGMPISL
ncbi:MAG: TolC family protein [Bacteroidales bacterium]|nr:TolC family protein [Bacteroidales bacterium]MDD4656586.1 TolC family protein [Bacteroidales bacterium]